MLMFSVLLMLCHCEKILSDGTKQNHRGPKFKTEPAPKVEFSNTAGTEVRCEAEGKPLPKIHWQTQEGSVVVDVPGLRYTRSEKDIGTIVFPPFSRADFRQEVHDAVYQCVATNDFGTILSREVHVKTVVKQRFSPQVYDEFVTRGNTAVLRCHLPSFAKEHVLVDAWLRNDGHVLKAVDEHSRGRPYNVLKSGELLIHNVREKDSGWSYRCQTRHKLTGEMVTSETEGKIIVTDPHASTMPRFTFSRSQVKTDEGSLTEMPCVAQGNPPPSYRWVKEVSGVLLPVNEEKNRIWTTHGLLTITKALQSDAGQYQCIARNNIGERRIETTLVVTAPLVVTIQPQKLELSVGQEATFSCNVTGYPLHQMSWMRDKIPVQVSDTSRARLLSRDVLHISSVRREDRGVYQCFAHNDQDSAQDTVELHIADAPPSLISVFPERTVDPGSWVTMRCVATGNPLPKVTWFVDDDAITNRKNPRVLTNDYVTEPDSHVISHLNISESGTDDGGEYTCKAINAVGEASHVARLNVQGPPFVRPMKNITAISGKDLTLRCPYGGYPIRGIRWFKDGILLPVDMRQKVNRSGILTIHGVLRAADKGHYNCVVKPMEGLATASGSAHVSVVVPPMIEAAHLRDTVTVNEDSRTKLMCVVNDGDPPLQFRWLKNEQPFLAHGDTTVQTFEDTSIITFKKVSSSDGGLYTCVVSNTAAHTNKTTQLVVNVPPQWSVQPQNSTAVLGSKVWMDCSAVGYPAPNILWKKLIHTENDLEDFTWVHSSPRAHRFNNGTLTLNDVEKSDGGLYLCQAYNGIGAAVSKIIALAVLIPPRIKESFESKLVAEGAETMLKCVAEGDSPIDFIWEKEDEKLIFDQNSRFAVRGKLAEDGTSSELVIKRASRNEDTGKYTCIASNTIGNDQAQRQLIVQGVPDPPAGLSVNDLTSRSANLRWEVQHDGNSHRTGSVVQYKTDLENDWTSGQTSQLIVSGSDNSATLRALKPVTTYFVRVLAENALGRSGPSDIINVTTNEEAPSGSPKDVQVHSTGAQSMKVLWKAPPEETRNGYIQGYYVGYRMSTFSDPYHFQKVDSTAVDDNQLHSTYITGLKPFSQYDIVVKAFNSAGTGPKSSKVVGRTLETAPPTSPIVQVQTSSSSTLDISWDKNSKEKSAITEYTVHYRADDDDQWHKEKLSGQLDRYTLRNLKCGTRYSIYVTASNSLGTGEPSKHVNTRTKGAAPMSPKIEVFLTANSTSATLHLDTWQSMGCPVQGFTIQYRPKHHSLWTQALPEKVYISRSTYVLNPLASSRDYVVLVTAHSEAGATQGEYHFRTLTAHGTSGSSPFPAYGVQEKDQPFYKNVALVIPVVVSFLVLIIIVFAITICLRKQSQDRRDRLDYGSRRKSGSDSVMMNDIKNKSSHYNLSVHSSHYAIPSVKKTDYAEPYASDRTRQQNSDGLFATIKRGPTRPLHVSAQPKTDGST